MNTAWLFGGVDMKRWIEFKPGAAGVHRVHGRGRTRRRVVRAALRLVAQRRRPVHGAAAVGLLRARCRGPDRGGDALAPADGAHLEVYRAHAPGFENAFLMLCAPQIGVRHARRLQRRGAGDARAVGDATPWDDEIGVSPSLSPKFPPISVPYGAWCRGRSTGCWWRAGTSPAMRQPHVPARDPAMLAHRAGGRRRGGAGGPARGGAAGGAGGGGAGGAGAAGGVYAGWERGLDAR